MRRPSCSLAALAVLVAATAITAQTAPPPPPVFTPIATLPFATTGPVIRAGIEAQKPFSVVGPRGVLLGQQDGSLEAWVLPVKLLSQLTIEAQIEGYPVSINVNQLAAEIEVRPDRTVITYSHVGFTVRQIMFSPDAAPTAGLPATGPVILFEFDCLHPTDFTFRFSPDLQWMWPERNEGVPGAGWISPDPLNPFAAGGFYALQTDYPDLAAAVTIPGAAPGILAPYQEHPKEHAVELKLHIDPVGDHGRLFPLLMAVGTDRATATDRVLGQTLAHLNEEIPVLYDAQSEHYKTLLANSVSIETPDKSLDEAFQWAVVSIEQLKTRVPSTAAVPGDKPDQTALVAGYLASYDTARPGFGWFFGRDALYTLYAVNGYGDFALTRSELEFLIHRQRADGKIMHEFAQTASAVDWQQFPYEYAAADSTPLFLLAMADYLHATGDTAFLAAHRDAIEKAWAFETDPAHDTDHDGIYDNSQGTGWVESWPGGMPHQEIYLALLDQQASSAMATIEHALNDDAKEKAAQQRAETIAKTINTEYYDPEKSCYAFSRDILKDGTPTLDRTTTVYPALAWWDPAGGKAILDHPDACLRQFIASPIDTDWGTRDLANTEKIYDGMSYHQGSVWPLFTGWAALAEYRANQPLAGYQLLKENANLTRAHDLGADTELLSGDFFYPMGTAHQMWSSAMVITPTLRGLFGISIDAPTKTITVNPHLPASWGLAKIKHLAVGNDSVDLLFTQMLGVLTVEIQSENKGEIRLATTTAGAKQIGNERLEIPRPPVEVESAFTAPLPGARSQSVRVLNETYEDHRLELTLEGLAGSDVHIPYSVNDPRIKLAASGAELPDPSGAHRAYAAYALPELIAHFPPGTGFQTITVTLTW
jgi:glycogen debranching enzyme